MRPASAHSPALPVRVTWPATEVSMAPHLRSNIPVPFSKLSTQPPFVVVAILLSSGSSRKVDFDDGRKVALSNPLRQLLKCD
jgi:hypothetical protein